MATLTGDGRFRKNLAARKKFPGITNGLWGTFMTGLQWINSESICHSSALNGTFIHLQIIFFVLEINCSHFISIEKIQIWPRKVNRPEKKTVGSALSWNSDGINHYTWGQKIIRCLAKVLISKDWFQIRRSNGSNSD